MVKSLDRLMAADTGYRAPGVWTGRISLSSTRWESEEIIPFQQELESRFLALPEVDFVGIGACTPLSGGCQGTSLTFVDRPMETQVDPPSVEFHPVSPGFFQALGIPVIQGRAFAATDDPTSLPVAIISRSAADQFWPGVDPVGRQIQLGQSREMVWEIVGLTETVRFESMERENRPQVFVPFAQRPRRGVHIAALTSGPPGNLTPQIRDLVKEMDGEMPLTNVRTMVDRVTIETSRERFVARLLSVFAIIAATLSAMGIFGVLAFDVTQRTRDIGIRMALGAQKDTVLGGVVVKSLALAAAGAGIGLAGSLALGRVMEGLLFGVETHDPLNLVLALVATLAVAALASLVPAFRAASVEPFTALKDH
jgi:predicted permease